MPFIARVRPDVAWWEGPAAVTLAVLAVAASGLEPRLVGLLYLAAVTPALGLMDYRERRLPNRLVVTGLAATIVGMCAQWLLAGETPWLALSSGAAYFAFLLVLAFAGGMGMGDVKLAGVLGLAAGSLAPAAALVSPLAAFALGGIAGLVALARRGGGSIPFGPFMLAGFWLAVLLTLVLA